MISFDRREALRYMGYHGAEPDAAVAESLERCAAELQAAVQPKSISARFPLSFTGENTMRIGDLTVTSANLARNLRGCTARTVIFRSSYSRFVRSRVSGGRVWR